VFDGEAIQRRTFHSSAADMVPVCDVVTINAPLHPETENLFDTTTRAGQPNAGGRRYAAAMSRNALLKARKDKKRRSWAQLRALASAFEKCCRHRGHDLSAVYDPKEILASAARGGRGINHPPDCNSFRRDQARQSHLPSDRHHTVIKNGGTLENAAGLLSRGLRRCRFDSGLRCESASNFDPTQIMVQVFGTASEFAVF
jgi:hypothetical protein